jgi:hypothetical protein
MYSHKSKEGQEWFIKHIEYLFKLNRAHRGTRKDYKFLRDFLIHIGYWRAKARGAPDADHFGMWKGLLPGSKERKDLEEGQYR